MEMSKREQTTQLLHVQKPFHCVSKHYNKDQGISRGKERANNQQQPKQALGKQAHKLIFPVHAVSHASTYVQARGSL